MGKLVSLQDQESASDRNIRSTAHSLNINGFDPPRNCLSINLELLFASPDRRRLLGDLRTFHARLASYENQTDPHMRLETVNLLFEKAWHAFKQKQYDSSWKCLEEADRLMLFLMTDDERKSARDIIKSQGAKKLNGWRRDSFRCLMKKSKGAATPEILYMALGLINDSQESRFHGIRLAQRHTNTISIILLVLSILFLINAFYLPDHLSAISALKAESSTSNPQILVGAFLMGGMGACVSALMSFSALPQSVRIPDRIMNFVTTFVRPVVGGASGLASALFLLSGVIHLGNASLPLIYTIAFAFGFSERLVVNTVKAVAPNGGDKGK